MTNNIDSALKDKKDDLEQTKKMVEIFLKDNGYLKTDIIQPDFFKEEK